MAAYQVKYRIPPARLMRFRRRGRSESGYTFARHAPGPALHSQHEYSFADALEHENHLVMDREDFDPVYRGEVRPADSCARYPPNWTQQSREEDQLEDTDIDNDSDAENIPPARASSLTPTDVSSSPLTPTDVSELDLALRQVEPQSDSTHVERLGSPFTPAPRRPLTYSKIDRDRHRKAQEKKNQAAVKVAALLTVARRRLRPVQPQRRSRRLRQGRLGDNSDIGPGLWEREDIIRMGHIILDCDRGAPTALVDKHDYIMAVIAYEPKNEAQWWATVVKALTQDAGRIFRNGQFDHLGEEESRLRFGIGFGEHGPKPHLILNRRPNNGEVKHVLASGAFNAVSAYQNHLLQQFMPKIYAEFAAKMDRLFSRTGLTPAFQHSVFTTSEISFGDAPSVSRKNMDAAFFGFEALFVFGTYDWKKRGHIIFWDDERAIPLRPGTTVLFPAGTKRYSFLAVASNETRFVFRQFCHSGIIRWLERGGISDLAFEESASVEEMAAWNAKREARGRTSAKMYGKLKDVYVF